MNARARRWQPPADLRPPLEATRGVESPTIGAFEGPVYKEGEGDPGWQRVPLAIDKVSIIASPATGSTTTLVSWPAFSSSYRCYIDGIFPYVEGAGGPITSARIPVIGGSAFTWRLIFNNVPVPPFDAITTILMPWGQIAARPLIEIPPGAIVSVSCTNTDPTAAFPFIGVRVTGRQIPLDHAADAVRLR